MTSENRPNVTSVRGSDTSRSSGPTSALTSPKIERDAQEAEHPAVDVDGRQQGGRDGDARGRHDPDDDQLLDHDDSSLRPA